MSVDTADLVAYLRAETADFSAKMLKSDMELHAVGNSAAGAMGQLNKLGTIMAGLVVGGFAASAKSAMDYNAMLSKLQANTTLTAAQMGQVSQGILTIFKSSNAPLQGIADGFMHVSDMGFSVADSLNIVAQANKSAASAGGDLSTTANLLATVLHEYGKSAKDAATYIDLLHQAGAMGNMTFEQFGNAAGKTIAMAANLGVPIQDVAAAFAAVTRHGIDAAQTATMLSGALVKIMNPAAGTTKLLAQISRETGINLSADFTQAGLKSKGLAGVLTDLGEASKLASVDVMKLIPATRGGLAALILTGTGTKDYSQILKSLNDVIAGKIHPTQTAWLRTQQQLNFQIGMAWNNVQALGIVIGQTLLPPLSQLLSLITPLISNLTTFVSKHQDWVNAIGLIAGAFLGIKAAAGLWELVIGPIIAILDEFWIPLALVGGLILGFKKAWDTNLLGIKDALTPVLKPLTKVVKDLGTALSDLWTGVTTGKWTNFGNDLTTLGNDAGNLKDALVAAVETIAGNLSWSGFSNFYTWLTGTLIPELATLAKNGISLAIKVVGDVVGAVRTFVTTNGPKVLAAAGDAIGIAFHLLLVNRYIVTVGLISQRCQILHRMLILSGRIVAAATPTNERLVQQIQRFRVIAHQLADHADGAAKLT